MRHGSYAGAQTHYRAGEKPCDLCRGAHNEYARIYRRHGAMFKADWASTRIAELIAEQGPSTRREIIRAIEGDEPLYDMELWHRSNVRRTLYRMVDRGEIMCDPYTRLYSVGGG